MDFRPLLIFSCLIDVRNRRRRRRKVTVDDHHLFYFSPRLHGTRIYEKEKITRTRTTLNETKRDAWNLL